MGMKPDLNQRPRVRFPGAREDRYYTLMLLNRDHDIDYSWPSNTREGTMHIHWVVKDIKAATLKSAGDIAQEGVEVRFEYPQFGAVPTQRFPFYLYESYGHSPDFAANPPPFVPQVKTFDEMETWMGLWNWTRVGENYMLAQVWSDTYRLHPEPTLPPHP